MAENEGMTFKARPRRVQSQLPNLPALRGETPVTQKKRGKKRKSKVSGVRTIDYQDLAPGVRVTQTPGM